MWEVDGLYHKNRFVEAVLLDKVETIWHFWTLAEEETSSFLPFDLRFLRVERQESQILSKLFPENTVLFGKHAF
jgi:hypothetical protein